MRIQEETSVFSVSDAISFKFFTINVGDGDGKVFWEIRSGVRVKLAFVIRGHYIIFFFVRLTFHPASFP